MIPGTRFALSDHQFVSKQFVPKTWRRVLGNVFSEKEIE
jgi:hypothetical protein